MKKLIRTSLIMIIVVITLNIVGLENKNIQASTSQRYKIVRLKSGYKFKLFHDAYIKDLAANKKVKIYFSLGKVSSSRLRSSVKSIIKTYNSKRVKPGKISLYYVKPKGKVYTVRVIQGTNNYLCDDSGWSYACANASVVYVNKKTVHVSSNLQKRILFHEFLHVFGFDHVKSNTKGSSLTPAVNDGYRKFSINNYARDLEAWRILNKPFSTRISKKGKKITKKTLIFNYYPYKKFVIYKKKYQTKTYYHPYNSKLRWYYKYSKKGRIFEKKEYFPNGKTRKSYRKYYSNKKLREYITYTSKGKRIFRKNYYSNGKLSQYIKHYSNGKYEKINKCDSRGRITTGNLYYSNGVLKRAIKYYSNGKVNEFRDYGINKKLLRHQYNYLNGKIKMVYTYSVNGILEKITKYFANETISEILMYENGKLVRHIKYTSNKEIYFDESYYQ